MAAANINYAENMREFVLTKVPQLIPQIPTEPVLEVDWNAVGEDFEELLNSVQQRFAGERRDVAGDTRNRLAELVPSCLAGEITRSQLHTQVCLLLIGHADLFNRFERLRFMNDGREETHRKIRQLEDGVRFAVMSWINRALQKCRSAIVNLNKDPVTLDLRDLEFIATVCFKSVDPTTVADANERFRLLQRLVTNPTSVGPHFLTILREKSAGFRRVEQFLSSYFVGVVSTAI